MKKSRTTKTERKKRRFVRKLNRLFSAEQTTLLIKNLSVRSGDRGNGRMCVIRDGEIYFLTENDSFPFYYDYYSQIN